MVTEPLERPRCVDCGAVFASEAALREHQLKLGHGGLEAGQTFECPQCGSVAETERDLERHLEVTHAPN